MIALTVSPNGKWISSGGRDGRIILWDAKDPMVIAAEWMGCVDSSQSFSFSPDSRRIAFPTFNLVVSGSDFETFCIGRVDALNDPPAALPKAPERPDGASLTGHLSRRCAWSPDGGKLTSVAFRRGDSIPAFAYVWDTTTYTLLRTITDHPPVYANLRPSRPSGQSSIGWNSQSSPNAPLVDCLLHGHHLAVVWFPPVPRGAPGPNEVPSQASRCILPSYVWDTNEGTPVVPTSDTQALPWSCTVTFNPSPEPDQATVICGDNVGVWSLQGTTPALHELKEYASSLFSRDGRLRLRWHSSRFRVWDIRAAQCVVAYRCAHIVGGCFSPDGEHVAVCIEDGRDPNGLLQVGTVSDGVLLGSFRYRCRPKSSGVRKDRVVAFSTDGRTVYLGTSLGQLHVYPLRAPLHDLDATHEGDTERWEKYDEEDIVQ